MALGLKRDMVKLVPYTKAWAKAFESEKAVLKRIFPDAEIEHIGSTAIPGITAKPILDILIVIPSFEAKNTCSDSLEAIGYHNKGFVRDEQLLFVKGSDKNQTVYLSLTMPNSPLYTRCISLRDVLRKDPKLAKEYSDLKEKITSSIGENDRKTYTAQKKDFIEKVLERRD